MLDKRLVIVSGKGGVGKSAVAAGLVVSTVPSIVWVHRKPSPCSNNSRYRGSLAPRMGSCPCGFESLSFGIHPPG